MYSFNNFVTFCKNTSICFCVFFTVRTKRTSPLQTPWIPQSLRDLLRFARQMQSALADIFHMHLVASLRSVFCLIGNSSQFPIKQKNIEISFFHYTRFRNNLNLAPAGNLIANLLFVKFQQISFLLFVDNLHWLTGQ